MANDNVCLELVRLLLVVKHPDEEEPQAPLSNSFKITIEQTFLVGQLQRFKFGIIDIITASFASTLLTAKNIFAVNNLSKLLGLMKFQQFVARKYK